MKKLSLILIGGGDRGRCYMKYLDDHPEKFELVGIAEPVKAKRDFFKERYNVPEKTCVEDYNELLALPKFADVVVICTQDKMHYEPAMKAIEKKYHLLLEKPIGTSAKECFDIADAAKKNGVKVLACHILRYTPFYRTLKKFIADGHLGEIANVSHTEGVGNVHMSHSFVRGNWRRAEEATPMIVAKCCHDTDLLQWLLDKPCTKVQSFGTLSYFCEKNAPADAPMRCLDNCPHKDTCYYYAPRLYKLTTTEVQHFRAIVANKFNPTDKEVDDALVTSPYGRCVFRCDNDVVDRQIVTMQFGDDQCVTLTMSPFNKGGRTTVIMGTKGEIRANIEEHTIEFYDFETQEVRELFNIDKAEAKGLSDGHEGGDAGIMEDLYEYVANDNPSSSVSDVSVFAMSYLIAFAAEEARVSGTVIDMEEYVKKFI